ncbi:MAG TPA: 30S ribosome-binding factor RbfA [Planctomicrobium sp.]|nr:30S ribosome-binding factor RbfA [Planctomicrobium sp.]
MSTTRRTAKIAAAVRQVVSKAILFELRDPRVTGVTVLNVEVAPDLRTAKVYVSVLGDDKAARLSLQGLNAARGWIQSRIVDDLDLRLTPVLSFVIDPGVKKSIEISKLLREINPSSEELQAEEADSSDDEETDEESVTETDSVEDAPEEGEMEDQPESENPT